MKQDLRKKQPLLPAQRKMFHEVIAAISEAGSIESPLDCGGTLWLFQPKSVGKELHEFRNPHVLVDSGNVGQIADAGADGLGLRGDVAAAHASSARVC